MTHSFSHFDQIARQSRDALYLYVDIETIPSQDPSVLDAIRAKHVVAPVDLDAIEADKRLTDPAKIEADIEKKKAKAIQDHAAAVAKAETAINEEYRKTALDASTGHIVCACIALGDDAIASAEVEEVEDALDFTLQYEREMLEDLFLKIEQQINARAVELGIEAVNKGGLQFDRADWPAFWCGHPPSTMSPEEVQRLNLEIQRHRIIPIFVAHHAQFDLRYVWQRAVALGITPPSWWPIDARPWDTDRVQDTMTMWAGHNGRIGLDRLCRALGLEGKTGVDGSKVWDLVREGRLDEVVEYCGDDVRRLRSVHRRLIGLPQLPADADRFDIIMALPGDMEVDEVA